jgi:hypothetical protein
MNVLNPIQIIKKVVLAISIVCLASCSTNPPESLKVIPKDTGAVSVVDMYSLYKKGNLQDIEELSFFKTIRKEVRNEDKRIAKFIDDLMENPTSTGVDFTEDLFMFYVNEAEDEQYFCMSLDIANQEDFSKFIDELLDKSKIEYNLEKEALYKYILIENEVAIAWDNEKAVFLMAQNRDSRKNLDLEIETLFELKETKQITVNKQFTDFYKEKKDVSFWFSSNVLATMQQFKQMQQQLGVDISDNYMTAHLNFDDEKIKLNTKLFLNDKLTEKMQKHNIWNVNFNTKTLDYLPKESLANTSVAVDLLAYYELMKSEENLDQLERLFKQNLGFGLEEFMGSFKGSVVLSLADFKEVEDPNNNYGETTTLPIIGMVFDLNTDKYLKILLDQIPANSLQKRDGYYEVKMGSAYDAYLAFDKGFCLFTNDKKSIKAFKDGGLNSSSLANSDKAANFSNSGYYTFVNLDYNDYPKEIKKEINKMQSSKESDLFNTWSKFTKSMEMRMIDVSSAEFTLTTKSKGENSLHALLKVLDTSFKDYSSL